MRVRIGETQFDRVDYDAAVDVLYLHVGDPGDATEFDASVEGHGLRYDDLGRLVGITILKPRREIADRGVVVITTPDGRLEAGPRELSEAIALPAA
jgi:YD repeat-containing protein